MAGTYRALCTHGYAALTMQDIADETDMSKAALHYHYDSKRDLLVCFLEFLHAEFIDRVADPEGGGPDERLWSFLDAVLSVPIEDDDERIALQTAMLELKAQAPYDEAFRERLERFDADLLARIEALIAEGIEAGAFRDDVDPRETARFVMTALDGAHTKQVAVGQDVDCTRRMLREYVDHYLAADGDDAGRERIPGGRSE